MTDFPACTLPGCPDPVATVIRRTSGEVDLVHNCHDGLYAQKFPSEARAAAHWAMTYARNAPAAPRSEAPEGWSGSSAPSEPAAPLTGLCGLAAREAMREPERTPEQQAAIDRAKAWAATPAGSAALRRQMEILHAYRTDPLSVDALIDARPTARFPPYSPDDPDAGRPWPATEETTP